MTKSKNPGNKLKFDYTLTEMGLELEPLVMVLASWGHKNIAGTNNAVEQAREYLSKK
jgi:DNA-binding HxlR family transcriptional regulator